MSAPIKLNASQLKNIANALADLSDSTRRTGVTFDSIGCLEISIDGSTTISVTRDPETGEYRIDDRIGS